MEIKTTSGRRFGKKAVCLSVTAALAVTAFAGIGAFRSSTRVNAEVTTDYGLVENIQDGVILHCFDWSYNDITNELGRIAAAGFSSIQVSPVQPAASTGPWYWLYQPLSFSVAENGDLGTPEELAFLCETAHEYGIKVIVDVVANHLAGDHDNIQDDLKPDQYWHTEGPVGGDSNRYLVTHGTLGMPDLNSEDSYVQQVVADYINELKGLGVDGIRWDAAKHIGLPSEDCDFWPAVTASGLYHYGEILNSPGGSDGTSLMQEYTQYMSVTDNSYATTVLGSFKKGEVPTSVGNWCTKDVDANKLVYWGESHDTYSNGEGKETNGVDQNLIDRTYAVMAARADATSLYLSRPFATAQDSIRIGVKGSMHFTSPEITAVNHFHNKMVGTDETIITTDEAISIVRGGGGVVIVCGSGSGYVTVPLTDAEGVMPDGAYYDEVTGNEFFVSDNQIFGKVGESGIAVVYDSDFASSVYAEPDSDTSFTGSLDVTLHAIHVSDAKYFVYGTTENNEDYELMGNFEDGEVITIGPGFAPNSCIAVDLRGIGFDGSEVTASYLYNKLADRELPKLSAGGMVFDNSQTQWDTVNVYVYDESGATTITNGTWPGVRMTDCGDDYFSYELPEQFASCNHIMVIFNNGNGDQIPGAMQDGMTMAYTDKKLYDGTMWTDLPDEHEEASQEESSQEESSKEESSKTSEEESSESSVEESSQESSEQTSQEKSDTSIIPPASSVPTPQPSVTPSPTTPVNTADGSFTVMMVAVAAALISGAVFFVFSRKKKEN